jgi:hypothetical protein
MVHELTDVILTRDLPEHGLARGDIGMIMLIHRRKAATNGSR